MKSTAPRKKDGDESGDHQTINNPVQDRPPTLQDVTFLDANGPPPRICTLYGRCGHLIKVKGKNSYISRYPDIGTVQNTLHFIPWQTCSFQRHLDLSVKHSNLMHKWRTKYTINSNAAMTNTPLTTSSTTQPYVCVQRRNLRRSLSFISQNVQL